MDGPSRAAAGIRAAVGTAAVFIVVAPLARTFSTSWDHALLTGACAAVGYAIAQVILALVRGAAARPRPPAERGE